MPQFFFSPRTEVGLSERDRGGSREREGAGGFAHRKGPVGGFKREGSTLPLLASIPFLFSFFDSSTAISCLQAE